MPRFGKGGAGLLDGRVAGQRDDGQAGNQHVAQPTLMDLQDSGYDRALVGGQASAIGKVQLAYAGMRNPIGPYELLAETHGVSVELARDLGWDRVHELFDPETRQLAQWAQRARLDPVAAKLKLWQRRFAATNW